MRRLLLAAAFAASLIGEVDAHTIIFSIPLPTTNQDGSTLAESAITAVTGYDIDVPAPNLPGNPITCPVSPLPPTTATVTCTTGTITPGTHHYQFAVSNSAGVGAVSATVQVIVPQSTPSAPGTVTATVTNP